MIKKLIAFYPKQIQFLISISKKINISVSEYIRRLVDNERLKGSK